MLFNEKRKSTRHLNMTSAFTLIDFLFMYVSNLHNILTCV